MALCCCRQKRSARTSPDYPVLKTMPMSHYCEIARWSLQDAEQEVEESTYLAGIHLFFSGAAKARQEAAAAGQELGTGKDNSLPLLIKSNGTVLDDSWAILEEYVGTIPEDFKDLLNKQVGPQVRTLWYSELLKDEPEARAMWLAGADAAVGAPSWQRFAWRWVFASKSRKVMQESMVKSDEFVAQSLETLHKALDKIDIMIKQHHPLFDKRPDGKPSAAAIALTSLLMPLAAPTDFKPFPLSAVLPGLKPMVDSIAERTSGRFAIETYKLRNWQS